MVPTQRSKCWPELCCLAAGGFSANLNLNLNGSNGFKINGIDAVTAQAFQSVQQASMAMALMTSLLGLIVPTQRSSDAGESYVVFGSSGGFSANLNLSTLNGSNGFKINGIDAYDRSGSQSVQQAMSMAMALMTSLLGLIVPIPTVVCWRELCVVWHQEDSVPTST